MEDLTRAVGGQSGESGSTRAADGSSTDGSVGGLISDSDQQSSGKFSKNEVNGGVLRSEHNSALVISGELSNGSSTSNRASGNVSNVVESSGVSDSGGQNKSVLVSADDGGSNNGSNSNVDLIPNVTNDTSGSRLKVNIDGGHLSWLSSSLVGVREVSSSRSIASVVSERNGLVVEASHGSSDSGSSGESATGVVAENSGNIQSLQGDGVEDSSLNASRVALQSNDEFDRVGDGVNSGSNDSGKVRIQLSSALVVSSLGSIESNSTSGVGGLRTKTEGRDVASNSSTGNGGAGGIVYDLNSESDTTVFGTIVSVFSLIFSAIAVDTARSTILRTVASIFVHFAEIVSTNSDTSGALTTIFWASFTAFTFGGFAQSIATAWWSLLFTTDAAGFTLPV